MPNVPSHNWGLEQIVADLRASREELHRTRHPLGIRELPSREAVINIVTGLRAALFPTHYGAPDLTDETVDYYVGHTLESTLRLLAEQIRRALRFLPEFAPTSDAELRERAFNVAREFGTQLPGIRALLVSDIQAAFTGDPAAQHITEILLCYPGAVVGRKQRRAQAGDNADHHASRDGLLAPPKRMPRAMQFFPRDARKSATSVRDPSFGKARLGIKGLRRARGTVQMDKCGEDYRPLRAPPRRPPGCPVCRSAHPGRASDGHAPLGGGADGPVACERDGSG